MHKFVRALFLLLLASCTMQCYGADFYVHKGASGSNNGANWSDAWNEMNQINFSSVACGDTIWVAGGNYSTTLTAAKNCSSGSPLTINRVLASDSTAAASPGWSSAFASQVVIASSSGSTAIRLKGINNVIIDGRAGAPSKGTPYGILVQCTVTSCDGIDDGASNNNYTIQNVEVYGPSCVMSQSCTGSGASGVNLPYGGTGFTYNNVYVHQWGEAFRAANWVNVTIQKSFIGPTHNDSTQHEDIIYDNGGMTGLTFRWNHVWSSPNDGIFFDNGGQKGLAIYGNVVYHSGGALITFPGRGTAPQNVFIYNNVFENDGTFGDYQPGWIYFVGPVSGAMENNVFENVYLNGTPPSATDYNAYNTCGDMDSGAHSFCYTSGTQFMAINTSNPLLSDWHLTSAGASTLGKGATLGAPYNVDPDGNTRGANGSAWSVGAYQYGSAASQAPNAPSDLTGTAK
jgi:hypothetical protein